MLQVFGFVLSWRLSRERRQDLCDREQHCLKVYFAILYLFVVFSGHAIIGLKGPQKPKTDCDNKLVAIISFTSVFTVRSGTVATGSCDLSQKAPTARSNYGFVHGSWLVNTPTCYRGPNPRTTRVNFKVRKMAFWTPRGNAPKKPIKMSKMSIYFWDI